MSGIQLIERNVNARCDGGEDRVLAGNLFERTGDGKSEFADFYLFAGLAVELEEQRLFDERATGMKIRRGGGRCGLGRAPERPRNPRDR